MKRFRLVSQNVKRAAIAYVANLPTDEKTPLVITIKEEVRNLEQNAAIHALIDEIAAAHPIHGRLWDAESMKRILVDQFWRDTKAEYPDLWAQTGDIRSVPSIDGSGIVSLGAQTRKFPKRLCGLFIEWLNAFNSDCERE